MKKIFTGMPRYVLVQKEIVKLIKNWDKNKPLPNEEILAKEMGVSRTTVREAIQELVNSGVLIKRHGVGNFIKENYEKVTTGLQEVRGLHNIIKSLDMEVKMKEQRYEIISIDNEVATALEINVGEKALKVFQVYLADQKPVMIAISYINPKLIEGAFEDFANKVIAGGEKGSELFEIIEEYTPEAVHYTMAKIEAVIAGQDWANLLEINENDPLICLKDTHYNKNDFPLLYSVNYLDARRFTLNLRRTRKF
jgi:GntR family transcriptional regulator